MLDAAQQEHEAFENVLNATEDMQPFANVPSEVQEKMTQFHMNADFVDEVSKLQLPQFFMDIPEASLFVDGDCVLLQKEHLTSNFSLKGKITASSIK